MATLEEKAAIGRIVRNCARPAVVVELGAHRGEDFRWIAYSFDERLQYVMVEPDAANFESILHQYADFPSVRLLRGAIADHDGEIVFHRSLSAMGGVRGSGSTRKPTGHLKHFPDIKFDEDVIVPCWKLDTLYVNEGLSRVDLLWVDVQGAEGDVIRGGVAALARTKYLFIEAEAVEFYEGQALKPDLIDMLPGWVVIKDFGYNLLLRNEFCA